MHVRKEWVQKEEKKAAGEEIARTNSVSVAPLNGVELEYYKSSGALGTRVWHSCWPGPGFASSWGSVLVIRCHQQLLHPIYSTKAVFASHLCKQLECGHKPAGWTSAPVCMQQEHCGQNPVLGDVTSLSRGHHSGSSLPMAFLSWFCPGILMRIILVMHQCFTYLWAVFILS